ncbi:tetratricopeptide repeat-containing sensor histidine kinase [Mucilaginibacter flavidus]|uniref:tetratricopeptide repeat-containing sensor histidine kinase n=1 Tax=Mucilaginibacter flavidus TaxID=2949309 RepID=UPI00209333E0|nr:sensor histidine kinase [Mucilaginibacter flavidus]MCO5946343.1 sensor histidine kinase [Mucilaginibacter flavidus]
MKKYLLILFFTPFLTFGQNHTADSLKKALAVAKTDTSKAIIYYQLAMELQGMDPSASQKMIDQALAISQKANYYKGLADIYYFKVAQSSYIGDFDAMKDNAEKCLAISKKYNFPVNLASAYNGLGIYYWQTGNYAEAIKNHLAALEIREKLKDEEGIAKSLGNLGLVYLDNEKLKEAESYSLRALALGKKLNNTTVVINCLHNLANLFSGKKEYEKALKYDEEALPVCIKEDNKRGLSQIYSSMAHCYEALQQYDKALKYQYEVLTLDNFFGDKKQVSDTYANLGELYKDKGDYAQAISWLKKSLPLTVETKYKQGEKNAWMLLSQVYEKNGNYKEALAADKKYLLLTQQLINEGNDKQIAQMQTRYETVKKEQKINILNKENTIQKLSIGSRNKTIGIIAGLFLLSGIVTALFFNRHKLKQKAEQQAMMLKQQDTLTKAIVDAEENERKRIASDLHDGVGQLFSAVKMNLSGLFDRITIAREEDRFLAENTLALVDESCKEVRTISHQMMPNMLLRSGIASDLKSFIEKIDSDTLKVTLEATGFKNKLESNVETMLYRIIQESINNVIKHAKATRLDLVLTRDAKGITAKITDNGIGFNVNERENFDGIGLKNIATRIEYLKGTIKYVSDPGAGTTVLIEVPVL